MPDYPYVYAEGPARGVEPGGARVRVLRRRPRGEKPTPEAPEEPEAWEALLREAVEELNGAFRRTGAPFTCTLRADDAGFLLHVRHVGEPRADPTEEDAVDEVLAPSDLPAWLRRLQTRLGLLVDETI